MMKEKKIEEIISKTIPYEKLESIYCEKENEGVYYLGIKTPLQLDSDHSKEECFNYFFFYFLLYSGSVFLLLSNIYPFFLTLTVVTFLAAFLDFIEQIKHDSGSIITYLKSIARISGKLLFGKILPFRNSPSWDLAIVITLIPFAPIFMITLHFTTDPKNILSVLAPYIVFLWNSMSRKSALYKACYDSYNKYLEKSISTENKDIEGLNILRNSLAIDILDFDLWAHKSFSELIIFEIVYSLKFIGAQKASFLLPREFQEFFTPNQKNSMDFSDDKFKNHMKNNALKINDVTFLLNLTFQLRNTIHKNELNILTKEGNLEIDSGQTICLR